MAVTISIRGQTVIPAEIRKKYGIAPRSKVEFIDTGEEIVVVPLPKDSFGDSFGLLKGVTTKDLVKERRKERLRERQEKE